METARVVNDRNGSILFEGTFDDCICWIAENGLDREYDNEYYIDEEVNIE